jgi:hypothetical protein
VNGGYQENKGAHWAEKYRENAELVGQNWLI